MQYKHARTLTKCIRKYKITSLPGVRCFNCLLKMKWNERRAKKTELHFFNRRILLKLLSYECTCLFTQAKNEKMSTGAKLERGPGIGSSEYRVFHIKQNCFLYETKVTLSIRSNLKTNTNITERTSFSSLKNKIGKKLTLPSLNRSVDPYKKQLCNS